MLSIIETNVSRGSSWHTAAVFLVVSSLTSVAPTSAGELNLLLITGYKQAYNLDHETALTTFRRTIETNPNDPAAYRGVAASIWLRILLLRGAVPIDNYLIGSFGDPSETVDDQPNGLNAMFEEYVDRAIKLSKASVQVNPDDPNAHYELGAAVGLDASYRAAIRGETFRQLFAAKRAYNAHERVLELDPNRDDAKLLIGIYQYVVSTLPRAFRMVAYLVGFDGAKEDAIEMVTTAAAYPGAAQVEAQLALVFLLNRERNYARAQRVFNQLERAYPRNRLMWLESAAIWLRGERPEAPRLPVDDAGHPLR